MKQIILSIIVCTISFLASHAQCDQKTTFTASKTEYLNANNEVQNTKEESTIVNLDKAALTILPEGSEEHKLTGTIKSSTCTWKVPFKEGKTVIKAVVTDESGDTKNVTLTIEGKEGKVTLLAEAEEMPNVKIKMTADKYEEKK